MKKGAKALLALVLLIVAAVAVAIYLARTPQEGGESVTQLEISEVMASNKGSVADPLGDYPDWIEFHNISGAELDIGGLGVSDDLTAGVKYVFPAGTKLAPDGYIILWCSGEATDDMHASFRVSASDSIVLFGASGNSLDTLVLHAVDSGMSYAKDATGAWVAMQPSPGYPNTEEGAASYAATMKSETDLGIYINEFMASNSTTLLDAYGNYSDWVELYNSTEADFDLSGCGLSDTLTQPKKYVIPDGTVIPAKGYLVIFCSGAEGVSETGELHAPFGLRAYGEDVVLSTPKGAIMDSITYENQASDVSFARMPDGTGDFAPNTHPTPGFSNDDAGYTAFMTANAFPRGDISISEILGANVSVKAAGDGETYDLIEIHNAGAEPASLLGYALSNNPNNPGKWYFPDVSVPADGYLLVYASGLDKNEDSELHTNFGISRDGDSVYLFSPDAILLDKLHAGTFLNDISYGRDASGALVYFQTPTFGAANGTGSAGITAVPVFGTTPGIYDGALDITLTASEGETIHYTTDCTTPTAASPVYTAAIHADKNTVVRAVSIRDGYITNSTVTGAFLLRTDGVDHALPVANLVTDPDNLWNGQTGIYAYGDGYDASLPYGEALTTANFFENGDEWERPAAFSVFGDDGAEAFSQNVGISIAGAYGRGRAQKGFNIIARDEYGANRMEYPFFDELPYTEYKSVVLRAGAQDQNRSKIRDELAVAILEGTDVDFLYQHYKPYVLYLNGEYWGVYFMKEKRNRFFVAQREGTENNSDMLIGKASTRVSYGTNEEWKELMSYVSSHDLSDPSAYAYVTERIDVQSFMDYIICELYTGNSDYANIQYYKLPDGKWKWIYYDFCWGFSNYAHKTVTLRRGSGPAASGLFNALLKNGDWRDAFCRRFAELLNTAFSEENVVRCIDELYTAVEPEIAREREKFNGATFMGVTQPAECLGSYKSFVSQIEYLKEFAQKRPAVILDQLKSELGLTDAYMQEVFG